jgi:hypothetical protein
MCQAYRTEGLSKTMTYKWHFQSRTWTDDDERLGKPWTSKTNDCPSERQYPQKLTLWTSCRRDWNIHWLRSCNFNIRSRDPSGLNEICENALTNYQIIQCIFICEDLMIMKMFIKMSSQEMRPGFRAMTKQNYDHCYGRVLIWQAPRRHDKHTWKQKLRSFFIVTDLVISLFQQNRWLIKCIIWGSGDARNASQKKKNRVCGLKEDGTSKKTTHRLTEHCEFLAKHLNPVLLQPLFIYLTYPLQSLFYSLK